MIVFLITIFAHPGLFDSFTGYIRVEPGIEVGYIMVYTLSHILSIGLK